MVITMIIQIYISRYPYLSVAAIAAIALLYINIYDHWLSISVTE